MPGPEAPVAVVGAGPVGLAVAIELGRRGIEVLVLERRPRSPDKPPTANHLGVRVMEILRRWGVAERVRRESFDPEHGDSRYWLTRIGGHVLHRVERPPNGRPPVLPHSPEAEAWSPKHDFDPILEDVADHLEPVRFAYGRRVVGLHPSADHVTLDVVDEATGARTAPRAEWVVGCDGAGSDVRAFAGIGLAGHAELPVTLQSVDFHSAPLARLLPGDGTQFWTVDPVATIVAIDPVDRFRIHFPTEPGDTMAEADAAARLDALAGAPLEARIRSVAPWRLRQALAARLRAGRVLLAGDAAKQTTPYGGLGMNYGIVDAAHLGWMLGAVVEGWGDPALLDAYDHERRGAARRLLAYQGLDLDGPEPAMTTKMALPPPPPDLHDDGPAGDSARSEYAAALVAHDPEHFANQGVDTDQRFADSPVVVPDGSPEPPWDVSHHHPSARPGHRAPHVVLDDGRSTLDRFDRDFTLLALGPPGSVDVAPLVDAARARRMPLRVVALDEPRVAAAYEQPLVLVRPDGIVAWRGHAAPPDPGAVLDTGRGAGEPR